MVFDRLEALFDSKSEELLFEYGKLINDYVIGKLSSLLWHHNRQQNPTDVIYQRQVKVFDWIEARHMELPEAEKTANFAMWDVTSGLLRKMEQAMSPASKLRFLSSAMVSLSSAYSLSFPGKQKKASADFFIPALVLVLLRTKLKSPIATYKYLQYFGNYSEGSDFEEQHRVFFNSCNSYLLELSFEALSMTEQEMAERIQDDEDFFSRRAQHFKEETTNMRQISSEFSMKSGSQVSSNNSGHQ